MELGPTKIWAYKTLSISPSFINIFDLSLSKGKFFDSNWEFVSDESIPVVLGYSYEEYMGINDEFTDANHLKYKVVGFLQDGQTFVDVSFGEGVIGLNDVVLMPIDATTLEAVGVFLFIAILVIVFASLLVIINTLEFVRKNIREFSIHIFCGATKVHIALRIFLQIFIVWLLSFILSLIISSQTFIVLGVSGIILFLCLGTCLPGFIKLFKLQISDILRRKD